MPDNPERSLPLETMRAFTVALSLILLLYGSTVQLLPQFNVLYVPLNLTAAAVLAWSASRVGLAPVDLGLQRSTVRVGFSYGVGVAAVAKLARHWPFALYAVALLVAGLVPALHPLFDDARLADIGPGLLAYRALIRIPLGTALFEEYAFRGVLFGAWSKVASPARAAVGSSLVFGLWHIRPTVDLLDANELATSSISRVSFLVTAVLLTATAGYLFCLLRIRTRSLLAPLVAHAAINSLAIVAAFVITAS